MLVSFLYSFNRQMGRKESEIQKEKEEKERIQEISLITAGINHEIRNPLNSLYLSFQMLEPLLDPDDSEAAFHSRSLKKENPAHPGHRRALFQPDPRNPHSPGDDRLG